MMFANSGISGLYKKTVGSAFIALLSACTTTPVNRDRAPVGGVWEQDENTDPRFVHFDRPLEATIGLLRIDGSNVFLNGRQVTANTRIKTNSHLRTGPQSGARIEFKLGTRGLCRIGILDFQIGQGYGDTAQCRDQMETPQGKGLTDASTVYHVAVDARQSEITIIRGRMEAWLRSNPLRRVVINSAQEVILTPDEIIGPRPVSEAEIQRRTAWRRKFEKKGVAPSKTRQPQAQAQPATEAAARKPPKRAQAAPPAARKATKK